MITFLRILSLAAALLGCAGCVTSADISCKYDAGGFHCGGDAGGPAPVQ